MKERHLLGNVKHEMKKASSSKLDLEESKNAAIDKTTGKNQAKSTSGGWKSRRSSISRLPCSLLSTVMAIAITVVISCDFYGNGVSSVLTTYTIAISALASVDSHPAVWLHFRAADRIPQNGPWLDSPSFCCIDVGVGPEGNTGEKV